MSNNAIINFNQAPQAYSPTVHNCHDSVLSKPGSDNYLDCIDLMTKTASAASKAIMNLFGGIEGFCQLPQLSCPLSKMGGTGYLDRFKAEDLCAPVMRGVDQSDRPFITFAIQQVVANKETHEPLKAHVDPAAYTIFKRYTSSSDGLWMSAGHPSRSMLPLRTANQQYVDPKTGEPKADLPKLKELLEKGYLVDTQRNRELYGPDEEVELHLGNKFEPTYFAKVADSDNKKTEL